MTSFWGPSALHYMAKKPTTRLFCHEFPRQCSERNTKTSQSPVKVTYVWKRFSTFRLVSEKNNHSIVKGRTVLFKTFPLCSTYLRVKAAVGADLELWNPHSGMISFCAFSEVCAGFALTICFDSSLIFSLTDYSSYSTFSPEKNEWLPASDPLPRQDCC